MDGANPTTTKRRPTDRAEAMAIYQRALRTGELVRGERCEMCGCGPDSAWCNFIGHHESYDRPLDVIWLCRRCHRKAHARPDAKPPRQRPVRPCGKAWCMPAATASRGPHCVGCRLDVPSLRAAVPPPPKLMPCGREHCLMSAERNCTHECSEHERLRSLFATVRTPVTRG